MRHHLRTTTLLITYHFDILVPPHTGHFTGLFVIGLSLRLG